MIDPMEQKALQPPEFPIQHGFLPTKSCPKFAITQARHSPPPNENHGIGGGGSCQFFRNPMQP